MLDKDKLLKQIILDRINFKSFYPVVDMNFNAKGKETHY